jgi:hypothetical protein
MLTTAQRERCRRIAEALDAGDLSPWRKAEGRMNADEKGAVWDLRRSVVAVGQREAAARPGVRTVAVRTSRIEAELLSRDLDFWLDNAEPDDDQDGDGDEEQETKLCPACGGKGRDHSGDTCSRCGGSGRLPLDDLDDDDDGSEDDEEE